MGGFAQPQRHPVLKTQVDSGDVAREHVAPGVEFGKALQRRADIVGGQAQRHAIVEPEVPAPVGDADRGLHTGAQLGMEQQPCLEFVGMAVSAQSDIERKIGMAGATERRDHIAARIDQRQHVAMLPDAHGFTFGQPHGKAARIDLLDLGIGNPGQFDQLLARRMRVDRHDRRRSVQTELLQDVDVGGLDIAADMHVLERKACARGHRLRHRICVTAKRHAVKAGGSEEGEGGNGTGMRPDADPAGGECCGIAHRTAQETRQDKRPGERITSRCAGRLSGSAIVSRYRRHEASSTIQLTNSSNE